MILTGKKKPAGLLGRRVVVSLVSLFCLETHCSAPAPVIHDRMPMPVVVMVRIEIAVQQAVPNISGSLLGRLAQGQILNR